MSDHLCAVLALNVFLCVVARNPWCDWLTHRSFLFLGRVSYGIYVLHGIVLYCASRVLVYYGLVPRDPVLFWALGAGIGCLVIAVASLAFRFVEYPFMSRQPSHFPRPSLEAA